LNSVLNYIKFVPFYLRRRYKNKYIIIESDDWGLNPVTSILGINYLENKHGQNCFTRWTTDCLESINDIELLFELLFSYNNYFEKPPVITANFITHNIKYGVKNELCFQPLSELLSNNNGLLEKYNEGIKKRIFHPQLHGYTHYNYAKLNKYFKSKEGNELFNRGFLTGEGTLKGGLYKFRGELTGNYALTIKEIKKSIDEFYKVFNYYPNSFVPPHFIMDKKYVNFLKSVGIKSIQGCNRIKDSYGHPYHKAYFRKASGLFWSPRNARLDPHKDYGYYSTACIDQINSAFNDKIPAVIDFHRVNIAGTYNKVYRDRSLNELKKLFDYIKMHWPETKFISSNDLITINE